MLRKQKSKAISLFRISKSTLGIVDAEAAAIARLAWLIDFKRIYMDGRVLPQSTGQTVCSVETIDVKSWEFWLLIPSYFLQLQQQPLPGLEEAGQRLLLRVGKTLREV